jgi:hypothetical protein
MINRCTSCSLIAATQEGYVYKLRQIEKEKGVVEKSTNWKEKDEAIWKHFFNILRELKRGWQIFYCFRSHFNLFVDGLMG